MTKAGAGSNRIFIGASIFHASHPIVQRRIRKKNPRKKISIAWESDDDLLVLIVG